MKLFATLASIVALTAYAQAVTITFDPFYDIADESLANVECSTGSNGMITKGFNIFSDLPTFPNIGAVPAITMFNDPDCGSCWNLTFTNSLGAKKSVVITTIDFSTPNFVTGETAMIALTGGLPESLSVVQVAAVRLASLACGL